MSILTAFVCVLLGLVLAFFISLAAIFGYLYWLGTKFFERIG